ncbi:MAG: outer membrane lipoprotein carrier protein LolA, partial [Parapedobacter sp.]
MHIRKISVIGFVLFLASIRAFGQQALTTPEINALKEKTAANAKTLQSLESNFTQTKHLSYLENAVQSSGKLYFKNPGKIRW